MPLNDQDMEWLVRQLAATSELLGHELKPNAVAMFAEDLAVYDRATLAAALQRVRSEHTGRLTPKVVLDRIDEALGRPAANEAWAMASQALDERATVVWTREMSDAWLVARPIAAAGDMVGARMAFIAAYERLVRAARDERRPPEITVSVGWDREARDAAIDKAMHVGLLSAEIAAHHRQPALPAPVFNPVALLTGRVEATKEARQADATVRERIAALREELASRTRRSIEAREQRAAAQRQDLAERKAHAQRLVEERLAAEVKGGTA